MCTNRPKCEHSLQQCHSRYVYLILCIPYSSDFHGLLPTLLILLVLRLRWLFWMCNKLCHNISQHLVGRLVMPRVYAPPGPPWSLNHKLGGCTGSGSLYLLSWLFFGYVINYVITHPPLLYRTNQIILPKSSWREQDDLAGPRRKIRPHEVDCSRNRADLVNGLRGLGTNRMSIWIDPNAIVIRLIDTLGALSWVLTQSLNHSAILPKSSRLRYTAHHQAWQSNFSANVDFRICTLEARAAGFRKVASGICRVLLSFTNCEHGSGVCWNMSYIPN